MRLRLRLLVPLVLLAASCSNTLGPGTPECGTIEESVNAVFVVQAQAVPDARFGPCINELKVGWDYEAQVAESGRAWFWFDSDRMGDRFVRVALQETCATGAAAQERSPFEGVERFTSILDEPTPLEIAIVPVAPRHEVNADNVAATATGRVLEGRSVVAVVESGDSSAAQRIQEALAAGKPVIIIDDREVAAGTLELRRPNKQPEVGISLDDALDEIEDDVEEPRYRATWYHTFEGGCIIYEFDASGFGAETVAADIDDALGLIDLAALRELGRSAGLEI